MLTLIFIIAMIAIFGKLIWLAIRMAWGAANVILSLVLLPGMIIAAFVLGLFKIALPVLAIVGLVALLSPKKLR
ncbi:MAG: hypothetical protein MJ194_04515 [Clostridia bacterium]|nr:hypothetical protein [Clostridia bacterium]